MTIPGHSTVQAVISTIEVVYNLVYRQLPRAFASLLLLLLLAPCAVAQNDSVTNRGAPNNVVFIMLDDADFLDFGFANQLVANPDILTPNIDRLRANGRLMSQYYAASAICSPTRASILTGNLPIQHGAVDSWVMQRTVVDAIPGTSGLPSDIPQLGHLVKKMGMRTGHFGKWHVGFHREQFRPKSLGWDDSMIHFFPEETTATAWHGRFQFVTQSGQFEDDVADYLDSYFATEVRRFIDESVQAGEKFFVNYWPLTAHKPWSPPSNFDNSVTQFDLSTDRGKLCAMMFAVDAEIGRIVDKLVEHGLFEDTLIVITSDNGGQQSVQHPAHLRGSKSMLFEGGISVPLVAHWPNGIAAGSTN